MTVAEIYNLTNTLLRKEIKGNTFSPNEFNLILEDVDDRFFRDKSEEYFSKNQNASVDDIYSTRLLRPLISTDTSLNSPITMTSAGDLTSNLAYWVNAYDATANKQINLVKEETLNSRLMSLLDDPLEYYPVAVIRGDDAYIYPSNLSNITLVYIRYPLTPKYDYYIDVNGNYVPLASGATHVWATGEIDSSGTTHTIGDPNYNSTTQELEYDRDIHPEFATRVLERAGVRMTNDMLAQYGLVKKQEEKAV